MQSPKFDGCEPTQRTELICDNPAFVQMSNQEQLVQSMDQLRNDTEWSIVTDEKLSIHSA